LKHVLKEKSPVLIFDHSMLPLFFLTKIFRRSKGVMLILSRPVAEKGFFGWLHFSHFRLSLMLSRSFVDKFTAISPFEAREFSKLGGVPTGKITVIPSTISESFERFALPKNIEELRLKLGLNALFGKKVVIYHGVLDEKKGVMKLVHIFNESFRDNNNIVLLIVGDGPARTAIEHWIGHNRVENIILLGRLPTSKVPEVVAAIDVGIILHPNHPWWRYQCNIKMIELLFMGKPILVSDLPGLRWIGANSPLVTYLNQSDPYSFKEESIKLISNLEQIAVHAADARQEMMNRFSSKAVAFRLKRLIDSLQASQ
jgi:glycosyltransferase involved in cell wall biosynthesis